MIVSSKIMKTEGHAIDPLFSFNGSMMSSKKVYIFSGVKNQVIMGKLTAVAAIKKKNETKKKTPGSETQFYPMS